jgi:PleD family two-component response regulator
MADEIVVPFSYAAETETPKGKQMNEKKDAPPTILMIELDDDTRPLLKQNLRSWGYRVIEALEEEDASALARGVRDRPKLILLNQVKFSIDEFANMGRRIRQVSELPCSTPIVVMAERYGEDMEGKDVKVGESEYVTYLEDGEQLMNLLHHLCPV